MNVIWVTGASRNVGRGAALELAAAGWNVAISARTRGLLDGMVRSVVGLEGSITAFPVDISDKEAVKECIEKIESKLGPITHALLAAQPYHNVQATPFDHDAFEMAVKTNLMGTVHCMSLLMEKMIARQLGRIVVLSTYASYRGLPGWVGSGVANAGLVNLCEAFYNDLRRHNVHLSLVNPGFFRADKIAKSDFLAPYISSLREASELLVHAVQNEAFEYAIPRRLSWAFRIFRMLPHKFYFRFVEKYLVEEKADEQEEQKAEEESLPEEARKTLFEEQQEEAGTAKGAAPRKEGVPKQEEKEEKDDAVEETAGEEKEEKEEKEEGKSDQIFAKTSLVGKQVFSSINVSGLKK